MKKTGIFLLLLLSWLQPTGAQVKWSFEVHGGTAINIPLPLKIVQNGYPEINLVARYTSESFNSPVYWDWRFSRWNNNRSWEFEAIHHKLYIQNNVTEIQRFSISHGFNLVFINHGYDFINFIFRGGLGVVLAHPENTIRNRSFNENNGILELGYYISGPALNFSVSRHLLLSRRWFLNFEVKSTFAYARIKIAEGHADVNNIAFHMIIGIGNNFIIRDNHLK